jgi:hydroxylamine reductase
MNNKRILSALIGLVGAVGNGEKTEHTDEIVRAALLAVDSDAQIEQIHKEKYAISPNCETCQFPCGNTSDYDMEKFDQAPDEIRDMKERLVAEMKRIATGDRLPDVVYKAIAYLGYDLTKESYEILLEELKKW